MSLARAATRDARRVAGDLRGAGCSEQLLEHRVAGILRDGQPFCRENLTIGESSKATTQGKCKQYLEELKCLFFMSRKKKKNQNLRGEKVNQTVEGKV